MPDPVSLIGDVTDAMGSMYTCARFSTCFTAFGSVLFGGLTSAVCVGGCVRVSVSMRVHVCHLAKNVVHNEYMLETDQARAQQPNKIATRRVVGGSA